eukprot:3773180-Pyramimonas_sp.AAC.1
MSPELICMSVVYKIRGYLVNCRFLVDHEHDEVGSFRGCGVEGHAHNEAVVVRAVVVSTSHLSAEE